MRVAYQDDPAIGITVNVICSWRRGEIKPVTGSSGLKDYTRNHVWAVFEQVPEIVRIVMVRGEYVRSMPFLLAYDAAGRVFDMAAREVQIDEESWRENAADGAPVPRLSSRPRLVPIPGDDDGMDSLWDLA